MNILNSYTLKNLVKNKSRTFVTIIGIILSVSMITAVTTFTSSLQEFMLKTIIANNGNWHGAAFDVKYEDIKKAEKAESYALMQNVGYANIDKIQNKNKPYIYVAGIDDNFQGMMPVNIVAGRMPEKTTEIILPEHLETNGGIKYYLDDVISLDIGQRLSEGFTLSQGASYLSEESGEREELKVSLSRVYTVVGFYERPNFEQYYAPGYTALTAYDSSLQNNVDIYMRVSDPADIYDFLQKQFPDYSLKYNSDLLRMMGKSNESGYNSVLYSLAAILIAIIMFASISLIYNAFSISLSERTKQYGLISSIGATKKQLTKSVLFEALFLSGIGIPFGVIAGITGIGVTLKLTEKLFAETFTYTTKGNINFALSVSVASVIIAAVVGLLTVLISAYLPARRAVKLNAIDAIRQTKDVNIKAKKVRTSKLTYKLFGFEGMIATKNFKRNKRKYRATVISLFLSVVLFISASSFCAYLSSSVKTIFDDYRFDIVYPFDSENADLNQTFQKLKSIKSVTDSAYFSATNFDANFDADRLDKDYVEYLKRMNTKESTIKVGMQLCFVDVKTYEKYLENNGFDKEIYMDAKNPTAIAVDFVKMYNGNDDKYFTFNILEQQKQSVEFMVNKDIEGYTLFSVNTDDKGVSTYRYRSDDEDKSELMLSEAEAMEIKTANIGTVTDKLPLGVETYYGSTLILMYPFDAIETVVGKDELSKTAMMVFKTSDHKNTYKNMVKTLEEAHITTTALFDYTESADINRAIIAIINIFSYGFITLISLIAAANVFNTISTNINLRRREFAMLKSIGMTQKSFMKMMNFECILYGFKGLVFGLPVSFFTTYLIYKSINQGMVTDFFIPANSVIIAVASVFAVVFATMLYSMKKIRGQNTIDELRNENL